jgi:hypothetical protein
MTSSRGRSWRLNNEEQEFGFRNPPDPPPDDRVALATPASRCSAERPRGRSRRAGSMTGPSHRICWLDYISQQELNRCDGNSLRFFGGVSQTQKAPMKGAPKEKRLSMRSLKFSVLDALDDLRTGWFARPAAEKFGGAWLACFLVMARGNVLAAFSFEHLFRASVCGIVKRGRRSCSSRTDGPDNR